MLADWRRVLPSVRGQKQTHALYERPSEGAQAGSQLSVAENIFLGRYPRTRFGLVDWKALFARAWTLLDQLGVHLKGQKYPECIDAGTPLVIQENARDYVDDNLVFAQFKQ